MSTKLVTWLSSNCLPCACKGTVNVQLCTIFNQTVPGQIIASSTPSGCESGTWKYDIQYDSDDLPEGVTALATTDISNVMCEGCMTTWIREQFTTHVVSETTDYTTLDFVAANDGDSQSITLEITNPSASQPLVGTLSYTVDGHWVSLTDYDAGWDITIAADGDAITKAARSLHEEETTGGTRVTETGTAAIVDYTIEPGATVEFELTLTADVTAMPASTFAALAQIHFFGVTAAGTAAE